MTSLKEQDNMPFGVLVKKQLDRKYGYVLSVKATLLDSQSFRKGLEDDCETSGRLRMKQQIHYELQSHDDGTMDLGLEAGSFQTFEQLLFNNPAIVAKSGFVDEVVAQLMDTLEELHAKHIYLLCLAPENLLIRKGDEMPMVLLHASSFPLPFLLQEVFAEQEAYIAPEILEGSPLSPQADIFSFGCFLQRLFEQSSLPYEYKGVIAKATQKDPAKRYKSVAQMRASLKKRHSLKSSFVSFVVALAIVLLALGLYIEMVPDTEDVEFVEPAPKEPEDDLLFDGAFNPADSIELEVLTDSGELDTVTVEQREAVALFMRRSEELFRKQFAQEADRVLSKIYSNENMNASEKKFMSNNKAMREELLKIQTELTEKSGISDEVAARISTEVLDQLVMEKQKQLKYYSKQ